MTQAQQRPQSVDAEVLIAALVRVGAALAKTQAQAGMLPLEAAQSILGTAKIELFDVPKMVRESVDLGGLARTFIQNLKDTVHLFNEEASQYAFLACTESQALHSAISLATQDALKALAQDLGALIEWLSDAAVQHAGVPLLVRGPSWPLEVGNLGQSCTAWQLPLVRAQTVLQQRAGAALRVHPSLVQEFQLAPLALPGGSLREDWLALGGELCSLTLALGQMAQPILAMGQAEVGEWVLPAQAASTAPWDSSQPHPLVLCHQVMTAAHRAPHRWSDLCFDAMNIEPGDAWFFELPHWADLLDSTHNAVRAMHRVMTALEFDTVRMATNLKSYLRL